MHANAYPSVLGPPVDMDLEDAMASLARLDGDGFWLDPVQAFDAGRLQVLADDPEFKKWLPWIRGGFNKERAREFAAEFSSSNWASGQPVWALRICGELMGVIDLRDRTQGAWEIGFWMHPDARGKGLMTRACALVIQAAFGSLGATRILHFARVGNDRSLRIARNLGFRPEGVRRKATPRGVERQWQSALLRSHWVHRAGRALEGPADVEVIDGARPSELVAQAVRLGTGETVDTPLNDMDKVEAARIMADIVCDAYELAGELGLDLEGALARKFRALVWSPRHR